MRMRSKLKSVTAVGALGVVASLAVTAAPTPATTAAGSTPQLAKTTHALDTASFWNARQLDADRPLPSANKVYEGNTDTRFLNLVKQAGKLPETGHKWRNAGPFGGIEDVKDVGSGNELFGKVGGIGTAMAVDPNAGNTVYLGTIGGLYKTTDGGRTVTSIGDKFARTAIGAIGIDPRHPQTVYAGTGVSIFTLSDDAAGVGVYVSHNGGRTWTRPVRNTHGYGTNAIVVTRTGTVLVGTTYGLWRSTDHGRSFKHIVLPTHTKHPLGNWVTSVVVNPANQREVTVAVGYGFGKKTYPDGSVLAPGNGLYRSTDGGRTFHFMTSTSQLTNPAASSDPFGRTSLSYSTAPGTGGHELWALVSDAGRTAGDHVEIPGAGLPVDGNTELNGIYRSNDDGATWTFKGNTQTILAALGGSLPALYALGYAPGVQASYNNWILTDPTDPNRIYIGLEEAFTGEDNDPSGSSQTPSVAWTAIEKYANVCGFLSYPNTPPNTNGAACPSQVPVYGSSTTHPDQHSAVFARMQTGYRLYSGNDGGWWAQDAHTVSDTTSPSYQGYDNGSWTSLNKPATVLPWDVSMLQDGSILLGLQDNGVGKVRKDGTSYQVCGGDGVYVFPGANAQSYYCGIDGQTIFGTTDDFKHTINLTPPSGNKTFLSPWAVDPNDANHLIAASDEVDETTAGVNSNTYDPSDTEVLVTTWQTVFTPPSAPHGSWDASAVTTHGARSYVAFCSACRPSLASGSAATPQVVTPAIATNVKPGCTPAKAVGTCWHMAASKGLPHEQISDIAVDPDNPKTIYVALRQLIVMGADARATGAQKVMVSHDAGETFHDLTGNLPIADVHRIGLRNGRLYVAGDVGMFTSVAGSKKWARFGTGIPQVAIRSMRFDLTGRYLVAGVYGRGAWVYDFGKPAKTSAGPTRAVVAMAPNGGSTAGWWRQASTGLLGLLLLLLLGAAVPRRRVVVAA
jgi:hypothetical protein